MVQLPVPLTLKRIGDSAVGSREEIVGRDSRKTAFVRVDNGQLLNLGIVDSSCL